MEYPIMSIQTQVLEIIEQVTNKKLQYSTKNKESGTFMFFDDSKCVNYVEEIEKALVPYFASIGIKQQFNTFAKNTFDVLLQSSSGSDDGAYLIIFYRK